MKTKSRSILIQCLIISSVLLSYLAICSTAEAQIQRYFRKSVSLFRIQVPADMSRHQGKFVYDALYDQLHSMGRFDYNPIPLRPGISLERLFEIVKQYSEDYQVERAAKQFELLDDHYKEERITGETLDMLIKGTYIIIPKIVNFNISKNVEKHTDQEGSESWKASVSVSYTLEIEVWNAENLGTDENPRWEPYLEDQTSVSTTGSKSKNYSRKVNKDNIAQDMVDDAVKNSLFLLKLQMGKALKELEMFTIKAQVSESNLRKDIVKFDFGRNVGLNIDDPFKVVYYSNQPDGSQKAVEVAYMKVRKTWQEESQAQVLILYNPEHLKESELINPGDQVLEHPKMGLNFVFRSGYAPYSLKPDSTDYYMSYDDGHDEYLFESDQGEISGTAALTFGVELDLAQFTGNSELYLFNDYTLLLNHPMWGGIAELGLRKKFYMRRLGFFYGASLGAFAVTGRVGEVPTTEEGFMYQHPNGGAEIPEGADIKLFGWTLGANLTAGFQYLLSPESALTFEGGYRFYAPIDGNMWTVEAEKDSETWEMEINEFEGQPAPADISGAWGTIGLIISI